jgi:hypothetical protein
MSILGVKAFVRVESLGILEGGEVVYILLIAGRGRSSSMAGYGSWIQL